MGLVVLRDHTNRVFGVAATVYQGNKDRGGSAGSLIVKTAGSIGKGLPEGMSETHLRVGKARGYPRSYPTGI